MSHRVTHTTPSNLARLQQPAAAMDPTVLEYLGSSGIVLSTEQRAALQSSLVLLKNDSKFSTVRLWGKVVGVARDMFIAQGYAGKDEFAAPTAFYSTDCVTWAQLPVVHPVIAATAEKINGRFSGDPAREYVISEPMPADPPTNLPDEAKKMRVENTLDSGEKVIQTSLTEDVRLAAVIAAIDRDAAVVPRGAYCKTPAGVVQPSRAFAGLSQSDAGKLQQYMHFREPVNLPKKSLLEQSKLDKSIDFMDPASDDVPNGCWSLQFERGGEVAVLRSLLWPGYTFCHAPGTRRFGGVYWGTGTRNLDIAFML